ncbi:hypothetical protein [Candidatus Tisiphia endosymbiont of Parasteatoda lunata]|uniref:hypothetical protein n=1 Tax=Candidatus Tisiphia endosymbiont of Parasteatoda lunata TaxID=3066275 RepID=UPI00313B5541
MAKVLNFEFFLIFSTFDGETSYDKLEEQKSIKALSALQQDLVKTQSIWLSDKQASVLLQIITEQPSALS